MPGVRTLADLVTQVRRRADMENTTFVTDEEIEQYVQDAMGDLWDILIEAAGPEHFTSSLSITTTAGVAQYQLDTDIAGMGVGYTFEPLRIYKTIALEILEEGQYRPLSPGGFYSRPDSALPFDSQHAEYFLTSSQDEGGYQKRVLNLRPTPQAAYSLRLLYIPIPMELLSVGSDMGGMTFQSFTGWDEFIITDAAAKCLEKEESDSRPLLSRRANAEARIRLHAMSMNQESGGRVRNVDAERRRRWWQR